MTLQTPHTTVLIIPTGIGAAIGGYAGDALPVARALAQVTDRLITHPNVMNGAQLYWPLPNAYYVEGYGLDQFAAGEWGLRPVHQNPIGLVFDQSIETDLRWRHFQAADAARATLGLDIRAHVVTDRPLKVALKTTESGASWGTLEHPDSLLRAAERLIVEAGVKAIAIIARFPDDEGSAALEAYRQGQGVDPLAGAEAVISHLVVRTFQIPCAHAPALAPIPLDPSISPRSAAEEIGHTFLPCVLAGLSRAPQFAALSGISQQLAETTLIRSDQVNAIVVPATAFGGSAAMSLAVSADQVIAVGENTTLMAVRAADLGIQATYVETYLEAVGAIAAYRAGVSPTALRPQIQPLSSLAPLDSCQKTLGEKPGIFPRPAVSFE